MAIGFNIGAPVGWVCPDRNLMRNSSPRVLKASFGDGYEQRLIDGINNIVESYSIAFNNRPTEEIDDIVAFFDTKAGVGAFDYTIHDSNNGGETTIKVVCETYNLTYTNTIAYGCTATFRRVYEP